MEYYNKCKLGDEGIDKYLTKIGKFASKNGSKNRKGAKIFSPEALFDEKNGFLGWAIRDGVALKKSSEIFLRSDDDEQKRLICQRKMVFCKVCTGFIGEILRNA